MAVSKAQQKAVHKYVKANYDRLDLTLPKGRKAEIKAHSEARGESVNGFINRAIEEATVRDNDPTAAPYLTSAALKTAQDAAQKAGEDVPQFVERAVTSQAERDRRGRSLAANIPAPKKEETP